MAKTKLQKEEILRSLNNKIDKAKSVVFTSFKGLTVGDNNALRQDLKREDSEYLVVKKTLLGLALKERKIESLDVKKFKGNIAAVFGYQDEVAPAKIVDKYRKELEEKIEFVGGILENKYLSADEVGALAKLPSKQELYAKIVGSINAPVSGFVNVLAGSLRKFLYALNAIKESKE